MREFEVLMRTLKTKLKRFCYEYGFLLLILTIICNIFKVNANLTERDATDQRFFLAKNEFGIVITIFPSQSVCVLAATPVKFTSSI